MTGQVLQREAGRVLLFDHDDRVFLMQGTDVTLDPSPRWWFTPGGGCDPGESHRAAAVREAFEELGIHLDDVTGPVHERLTHFAFEGLDIEQHELYFAARVNGFRLNDENWSESERRSVVGHGWWTLDQLRATGETVYPVELVEVLTRLLGEGSVPSA